MSIVYKISLIGDSNCGKTSYIHKLLTGETLPKINKTVGVDVHPLVFTGLENICFNVFDIAGLDELAGNRDIYYNNSNGVIIMFDLTSKHSFENVENWLKDIRRNYENIPIILVGNKCDLYQNINQDDILNFAKLNDMSYFSISVKTNNNLEEPFMHFAKILYM